MASSSMACFLTVLSLLAVNLVWHNNALQVQSEGVSERNIEMKDFPSANANGASQSMASLKDHIPFGAMSRSMTEGMTRSECSSEHMVWWLHIPKCGTSFGATLSSCKQDPTRQPGPSVHRPLPLRSHSVQNVVSIFREPSQRLASALTFLGFSHHTCRSWGCEEGTQGKVKALMRQGLTAATDDFLGKSFLGCQTNMVLGKMCMAGTPASPEQAAKEAIARVDTFFFVGLLEQWGLSICLFNYKVTGQRFITEAQLANMRPTAEKGNSSTYDVSGYPRDVADEMLYAHIVQRFHAEIKLHGISQRACSFDFDGSPLNVFIAEEFFAPGNLFFAEPQS